jgi:hypothetical protein
MKKPILIIGAIALILTSCTKKYCWKCTLTSGTPQGIVKTESSVCDKTQKEIKEVEASGTTTTKVGNSTYGTVMSCNQK